MVVKSEEAKAKLQKAYAREWFATAPLYIIGYKNKATNWVRSFDGKAHGDVDVSIATEHLCLAATERGLGTCWVCNFDAVMCAEAVDMGGDEYPAVLIALGHTSAVAPEKKRKPLDEIVTML